MILKTQKSLETLPRDFRVVVFFGADGGAVTHHAHRVRQRMLGDNPDPFRFSVLAPSDITSAQLIEEMAAVALTAEQRLVMLSMPTSTAETDRLAGSVKALVESLPSTDTVLVVQASTLSKSHPLRILCERHPQIAIYHCHGGTLDLDHMLSEENLRVDSRARHYLKTELGDDSMYLRSELRKLRLYSDATGAESLDVDTVRTVCSGVLLDRIEALSDAVFEGKSDEVEKALQRAREAGIDSGSIVRRVMGHSANLSARARRLRHGEPLESVVGDVFFFKRKASLERQLRAWSEDKLKKSFTILGQAELALREALHDEHVMVEFALHRLARQGAKLMKTTNMD